MSENSNRHADASWPHPLSEAARADGRYTPDPMTGDHDERGIERD